MVILTPENVQQQSHEIQMLVRECQALNDDLVVKMGGGKQPGAIDTSIALTDAESLKVHPQAATIDQIVERIIVYSQRLEAAGYQAQGDFYPVFSGKVRR